MEMIQKKFIDGDEYDRSDMCFSEVVHFLALVRWLNAEGQLGSLNTKLSEECSVDSGILGRKGALFKADSARRMRLRANSISTSTPDSSVPSPELSRVVNLMTAFNDSQDQKWRVQALGLLLQHSGNSIGFKRSAVRGLADILNIVVTDDDLAEV